MALRKPCADMPSGKPAPRHKAPNQFVKSAGRKWFAGRRRQEGQLPGLRGGQDGLQLGVKWPQWRRSWLGAPSEGC